MVSETAFRESSILNEKKSTLSLLASDKNFKDPDRDFVNMAQVESLTETSVPLAPVELSNIDENSKTSIDENNLKDDCESTTSDIELRIESDKETASENEDAIAKNIENECNKESNANKDVESLTTLDDDLKSAADLVRTAFSADEFNDEIDCLDAIDNSSVDTSIDNRLTSVSKPGSSNDSEKSDDSNAGSKDIEVKSDPLKEDKVVTLIEAASEVEQNNNTPETGGKAEKQNKSQPNAANTMKKAESEEISEENSLIADQSLVLELDSSETEESSAAVEETPVFKKSLFMKAPLEHLKKSDESNIDVVDSTTEVVLETDVSKHIEEMSVDSESDPTSKAVTVENGTNDVEKNVNRLEIDGSKQSEEISINNDLPSKVISINNAKTNVRLMVSSYEEKLQRNSTSNIGKKNTEECKSILPSSDLNSLENVQTSECSENIDVLESDNLCVDNIQEVQTNETTSQIDSAMVVDDINGPKSVDSGDMVIDTVESEVVELDAEDEPVILDDDDVDENSLGQSSQQTFNQFFENTAKELLANDDIGAEVVVGEEDLSATTSDVEMLNSLIPKDNESRKRRFEHNQDDNFANDLAFIEKRAKVNETVTSDSCCENRAGNISTQPKKKPLLNKARKHTSSTNPTKIVREIERRIQNDLVRQKNSRVPSPGQVSIDEFDLEINDNDDVMTNDERCSEAAQQIDNNLSKINLDYDVISKDNLKNIFKIMKTRLTRRQLEEIVIQKCCEMISDSNEIGTLRRHVADLQQAEMFRKQKILNLEKQISQLRAVCQRYLEQVKENSDRQTIPIKVTRSVGLQVSRDSTSYPLEPNSTAQNCQEKLKKLLSAPGMIKKPVATPENRAIVSRTRTASPLPSSTSHRNSDPRLMNGSARINSPLSSSSSPTTPCLSSSNINNSRNIKTVVKPISSNASVIDLTDKDDKNENEGNVAAKNLLSTVNGTILTYVPDQSRQVIKPGTSILVNGQLMTVQSTSKYSQLNTHPAPVPQLPVPVMVPGAKPLPPRPILKIDKNKSGIMLSWEFPSNCLYAEISKYQLYAYQETNLPPRMDLWKAVGDVSALPLPMACTLTQFVEGYKYHFIVRAVDIHSRCGPFSVPRTITL